jgi:hypothetical protein
MISLPNSIMVASTLFLSLLAGPVSAKERQLEANTTKKVQVRHSMLGLRDTLLFYTFSGQQAVLRLHISNKDRALPVTGIVYLFPVNTTDQGLKKWINNQHSDGLFPEVPRPALSHKLPKGICKATTTKVLGEKKNHPNTGVFTDHAVTVSIKAHELKNQFKLAAFKDKTGIFLPK